MNTDTSVLLSCIQHTLKTCLSFDFTLCKHTAFRCFVVSNFQCCPSRLQLHCVSAQVHLRVRCPSTAAAASPSLFSLYMHVCGPPAYNWNFVGQVSGKTRLLSVSHGRRTHLKRREPVVSTFFFQGIFTSLSGRGQAEGWAKPVISLMLVRITLTHSFLGRMHKNSQ